MKRKFATSPSFPRFIGSLLATVTLATQTLPASAQASPTNPPAAPSSAAPAPAPIAPPGALAPAAEGTPPTSSPPAGATASDAAPPSATGAEGGAASPPEAPAPNVEGAQAALAQGQQAYRQGDYAGAAVLFERSNTAVPSAEAQYWLAMALDLQGRATDAVLAFERLFADPGHTGLGDALLVPARQRFELLKKIPATVLLSVTPTDAVVEIDGVAQAGGAPYTLKLVGGKHALRVTRDGHAPLETELEVAPAQSLEQAIELTAVAPAPATDTSLGTAGGADTTAAAPSKPRSKVPAYVTLGVAGASAALGTLFGVQALGAKSDFDDSPTAANADSVERNALIADMAWGVALTLGITGIVLLTSDEPAEETAEKVRQIARNRVQVAPYVSSEGGGARARVTF